MYGFQHGVPPLHKKFDMVQKNYGYSQGVHVYTVRYRGTEVQRYRALQKVTEVHVFTERYRGKGIYRKVQRGKE